MIDKDENNSLLTLTINRPEKANALTEAMLVELAETIENTKAWAIGDITILGKVVWGCCEVSRA